MVGQLCTLILLCFSETCCQAKFIKKIFIVFYIVDLFFYVVRLYAMTKTDGGCLNE